MKDPIEIVRGDGPLLLAFPHVGTRVPSAIEARLNETGRTLSDTDWHVDRLYQGLAPGATILRMRVHRYVLDVNRDPSGASLYPGRATTELCPTTDFDGRPIWREGQEPEADEIAERRRALHALYHEALTEELARIRARHAAAVLYDCHSIRSEVPRLFEGRLPDFNIGTADGRSCAEAVAATAVGACRHAEADGFSWVRDGRFKGGWTTRHHGRPETGVHAIQMELAQTSHLETEAPPFAYDDAKAARLRPHLGRLLAGLEALARSGVLAAAAS